MKVQKYQIKSWYGNRLGDTCHVAMPLNKKSHEDMVKMDAIQFICKYPSEFRPGKEISKYQNTDWAHDEAILKYQIEAIRRRSTNGKSISWHDLMDRNQPGYFDGTNVDRDKLAYLSLGITKDEMLGLKEADDPQVKNISIGDAVRDYRTIKTLVPRFGGLSNSLMVLAIARVKKQLEEKPELMEVIRRVAHAKHILCQDGLSAKHATNQIKNSDKMHRAFYRTKFNDIETEEEYRQVMTDFGLPKEDIDAIMLIFWSENPENINQILRVLAPHYLATRRGATLDTFETIVDNCEQEVSLQRDFLEKLVPIQEVKSVEEHSTKSRRRRDKVFRKPKAV